jgi:hypothetical protein
MKAFSFLGTLVGSIAMLTAAGAQTVPKNQTYCAFQAGGGTMDCRWESLEQCQATFTTSGGARNSCMLNPALSQPQKKKK